MSLGIVACENDDEPMPSENGSITIRMNHLIDGGTFELNTPYDFSGQEVVFTDFRYYISNINFKGQTGTDLDNPEKTAWIVSPAEDEMALGKIDAKNIFAMDFLVGLDDIVNHQDPTMASEEELMNNEMHWGWNPSAGYKFMRIEGLVDGEVFGYHVATDNRLSTLTDIEIAFSNEDDRNNILEMQFDVKKLFEGITILEGQNHGENPITGEISNNMENNNVITVQ
ncbi:MAG: MbnP family protein [Bacteroidota bacterium]